MAYEVIRRDLTETTRKCDFCPRFLTSLKAYVLRNVETGELHYAGPACAKGKAGEEALSGVPDLTKFTMAVMNHDGGGSGGPGGRAIDNPEKDAVEYLTLREGKLAHELNCSYQVLREYYKKYQDQGLSDSDVEHINNIASKAPDSLTPSVLQRIYNFLFWIDVGIERLPAEKTEFLVGVRNTIIARGRITENQRSAINSWLQNIDGVPQLK